MSHDQYDEFFGANAIANLEFLDVGHATPHALGLINTTARLLAIPNVRWAGQQAKVRHVPPAAFAGVIARVLHDDVYAGMTNAQFTAFVSNPANLPVS